MKKLIITAVVAALLGGGVVAGTQAVAEGNRVSICKNNVNTNLAKNGRSPINPEQVDLLCAKGTGQFVIFQVKERF